MVSEVHLEITNADVEAHKRINIAGGGVLEAGEEFEIRIKDKTAKYKVLEGMKLTFSVHGSGTAVSV